MTENNINQFNNVLSIGDYISITLVHIKKILFILIFGLLISLYTTYTKKPVYRATTSVIIKEKPGVSMVMNLSSNKDNEKLENEIQLIQSRLVAKEVVKRFWESDHKTTMNLFKTRIYYPKGHRMRKIIKSILSLGFYSDSKETPINTEIPYNESIGEKYASEIIQNLKVTTKRNTSIIKITFSSVFAEEARRISDMIAIVYRDMEKELGNKDAISSVSFLTDLVSKQEKSLIKAEEEVKRFKIENNIYTMDGNAFQINSQLVDIDTEIYNNQSEVSQKSQEIEKLNLTLNENQKYLTEQIITDINIQVSFLRSEISSLESKYIQNTKLYGENHVAALELKNRIEATKEDLKVKINDLIGKGIVVQDPLLERQNNITKILTLESEIFSLKLREKELIKLRKVYNEKLSKFPDQQLHFSRLIRNEEVLKQNYSFIREKLEEAKIQLASTSGKVQILDLSRRPIKPVSPIHYQDIIFGIMLSIFFAFLVIIFIEQFDHTIKSGEDISKYGLTILGIIPAIGNTDINLMKKSIFNFGYKKGKNESSKMKRRLITREDPKSPVSEAYRSLRTSLIYADIDKEIKSVLVSSAGPGEGKTTTVANMAITYANLGKKTLLIDTDLRRPVVHKIFNLKKEPGITNYLVNKDLKFNDLIQKTEIDNLFIVPSGPIPPNPSEILGSSKMTMLIEKLEKSWDIILFDSPPLVAVTDATMVSKEIDKIIIVVKVGQTDKKAFDHTISSLNNVDAPIGGIVLNAVTQKYSYGNYYYYYQYYNYYRPNEN